MCKMEFVTTKHNSCDVVDVDLTTKLYCICGKTNEVELMADYERGYYGLVKVFLLVKCPDCKRVFERNMY